MFLNWRNIAFTLKTLVVSWPWTTFGPDTVQTRSGRYARIWLPMIEVKETDDGKWGLYLDGVLLGDSKHRYDVDHAKQILLRYLLKRGGETQADNEPT